MFWSISEGWKQNLSLNRGVEGDLAEGVFEQKPEAEKVSSGTKKLVWLYLQMQHSGHS